MSEHAARVERASTARRERGFRNMRAPDLSGAPTVLGFAPQKMPLSLHELSVSYQKPPFSCDSIVPGLTRKRYRTGVIIALLPPPLLRHVEFVIGRQERVVVAKSWEDLEKQLHVHPVTAALIDPSFDGASRATEFQRLTTAFPSLPVIGYVPINPRALKAVAIVSRLGLEHLLLYAHDDEAERMVALIDKVRASPLTSRFIRELGPSLDRLPVSLRKAVEDMFAEPHRYPSAQDLASAANVTIVKMYRSFRSAGLSVPKKMVVAAKLLRVFAHLRDPGQSVGGAAKKLAYRNPRILAAQTKEVFDMKPSRLRSHMTEDAMVKMLLAWVDEGANPDQVTAGIPRSRPGPEGAAVEDRRAG